jgi:hypothetical protein
MVLHEDVQACSICGELFAVEYLLAAREGTDGSSAIVVSCPHCGKQGKVKLSRPASIFSARKRDAPALQP